MYVYCLYNLISVLAAFSTCSSFISFYLLSPSDFFYYEISLSLIVLCIAISLAFPHISGVNFFQFSLVKFFILF